MQLKFPPLSGGIIQGLNDAGIETFEGDYAHYVVRECAQNSLDAAASVDEPVRLEIALHLIPRSELPFMPELQDTLARCREHWKDDEKATEYFEMALDLAIKKTINVLRISDFGTTGVPGGDMEMNKPWFGLVRSRGVSVKNDQGSAGAFGIGKDAPLAASQFRTAIYSTRTLDGKTALQGICRLATHVADNDLTQGTGFIGNLNKANHQFSAVRNEASIPKIFKRDEPGLDVWIIGFQGEIAEWASPFIAATLRNFWPAIHFEHLKVRVGQHHITRHTLPGLMHKFSKSEEAVAEAYPYFHAVVAKDSHLIEEELPLIGNCRLHVRIGEMDLPRKVCMTRKTGMKIFNFTPKAIRLPFAGFFQCEGAKGNQILKGLEPPSHDHWDAKRAKSKAQAAALQQIKEWVGNSLKSLIPNIDAELINEDSVADMLPDDVPAEADGHSGETDLSGAPNSSGMFKDSPIQVPQIRTSDPGGPGAESEGIGGEGEGEIDSPKGGDGTRTGGRVNRGGPEGQKGGAKVSDRMRVDVRSFPDTSEKGAYFLVLRSSSDHTGDIRVDAVAEDGASISCPLASALTESGKPLQVAGNNISEVLLSKGSPTKLRILLRQPLRVALRASIL